MKFIVSNMTCVHCQKKITQALKDIGIKKIKIDLESKEVVIKLGKVSKETVKEAIINIGYDFQEL
jgi:copper chaperone CopZ